MLVDYPAYRRISLAEEHQRLCFQIFVCCYPLKPNDLGVEHDTLANGEPEVLLQQVNEVLDMFGLKGDQIVHSWRQQVTDSFLTEYEVFLLELKCMNGSLLQLDQLACHCDRSKGHTIESTKIIAKVSPDDNRQPSRLVRETMESGQGQTMVPFIDRAFNFRPVRDRGNFRLDGSPHIGDDSRGVENAHEGSHSRD